MDAISKLLHLKAVKDIIFVLLILIIIPFFLPLTANLAYSFKIGILGPPVHQEITADGLSFLKSNIVFDIAGNSSVPDTLTSTITDEDFHFDNCAFKDSSDNINRLYDVVLTDLNPASPNLSDAVEKFGFLMHPVQDLYAHSNWVELLDANLADGLIEPGLGKWDFLSHPYTKINGGVIVIDGKPAPAGFELSRDDRIVKVNTPAGEFSGLMSGSFSFLGDISHCPENIDVAHGDLNKDKPDRPFFQEARNDATEQTRHEWCRLVSLMRATYGEDGVNFLFDNWVDDRDTANRACIITVNR